MERKRNVCGILLVKYFPVREDEIPVLESLNKDPWKLFSPLEHGFIAGNGVVVLLSRVNAIRVQH